MIKEIKRIKLINSMFKKRILNKIRKNHRMKGKDKIIKKTAKKKDLNRIIAKWMKNMNKNRSQKQLKLKMVKWQNC